ncbi:MAG TPA: hypothetical protein VF812_01530 [Ktedonobacterales bacterium]
MRGAGTGLIVLGVILLVLGALNHYVLKLNPIAHTSTIILGVGVVLAVIGVIAMVTGGRKA